MNRTEIIERIDILKKYNYSIEYNPSMSDDQLYLIYKNKIKEIETITRESQERARLGILITNLSFKKLISNEMAIILLSMLKYRPIHEIKNLISKMNLDIK